MLNAVIVHWSPWSRWTNCNASCGQGVRSRSRLCLLTSGKLALPEDARCHGPISEHELCQINPCPVSELYIIFKINDDLNILNVIFNCFIIPF